MNHSYLHASASTGLKCVDATIANNPSLQISGEEIDQLVDLEMAS